MRSDHIPPLRPGSIDVATLRIDDVATPTDQIAMILSADERAKADAFHFADDRRRSIVVRATLRIILAHHLAIDPRDVRIELSPRGRPGLADRGDDALDFNVSHSGDLALLAFGVRRRIGVDVERIRHDIEIERLAERFFAPAERTILATAGHRRRSAFFGIWTRKEACVKASGTGLSVSPETFAVDLEDRTPTDLGDHGTWATRGVSVDPGWVAALAFDGDPPRISTFDAATILLD